MTLGCIPFCHRKSWDHRDMFYSFTVLFNYGGSIPLLKSTTSTILNFLQFPQFLGTKLQPMSVGNLPEIPGLFDKSPKRTPRCEAKGKEGMVYLCLSHGDVSKFPAPIKMVEMDSRVPSLVQNIQTWLLIISRHHLLTWIYHVLQIVIPKKSMQSK